MSPERGTTQTLSPSGRPDDGSGRRGRRGFGGAEVAEGLPPLHPRGVGELLDTAVDALRARFLACVLVAASLSVAVRATQRFAEHLPELQGGILALGSLALALVVQSLTIGLVTVIVYGHMQGQRVPARRALATGARRAPALLVASLVTGIMITLGTFCFLVPGILLSWLWVVVPAALVLERLGPIEAMARSARLVRGSFWRWAGVMACQFAMMLPLQLAALALDYPDVRIRLLELSGLDRRLFDLLDVLAGSLLMGFATAFGAVVLTLFYLDARVRNEGFDLAMRLERLRERGGAAAAGGAA